MMKKNVAAIRRAGSTAGLICASIRSVVFSLFLKLFGSRNFRKSDVFYRDALSTIPEIAHPILFN
jgi:hypothetical protein